MTELHGMERAPEELGKGGTESQDDWWKSDRVDGVGWAALFLWGALVVVAENTSVRNEFDWWEAGGVFFIGAGLILMIQTIVRLGMPEYRSKWGWSFFWGTAFLAFGLGELSGPVWYALPLAALALIVLRETLARSS